MARSLSVDTPSEPLPTDIPALQAEVEHLRRALREVLQEKDRVLRLLRRMNTDLYGQVQGQTRQLSSLHHLINTINASLDLNEVAATALKGLQSLLGVEVTSLALLDSTEEVRYVMSQPPEMMLTLTAIRLKKGESVVGKVVEGGQAYLANDIPSASAQWDSACLICRTSAQIAPRFTAVRAIPYGILTSCASAAACRA